MWENLIGHFKCPSHVFFHLQGFNSSFKDPNLVSFEPITYWSSPKYKFIYINELN